MEGGWYLGRKDIGVIDLTNDNYCKGGVESVKDQCYKMSNILENTQISLYHHYPALVPFFYTEISAKSVKFCNSVQWEFTWKASPSSCPSLLHLFLLLSADTGFLLYLGRVRSLQLRYHFIDDHWSFSCLCCARLETPLHFLLNVYHTSCSHDMLVNSSSALL